MSGKANGGVRTLHLSVSPAFEADLVADVIRSDYPDDPVEAGRQIWIYVAPAMRKAGMTDAQIVKAYGIPDEVLSGEAERRARDAYATQRLSWIEGEPGKLYRGEGALIREHRSGATTLREFSSRLMDLEHGCMLRTPGEGAYALLPEEELRVRTVPCPEKGEDWLHVTTDHRPTWRRQTGRMSARFVASEIASQRRRLSIDAHLLAAGLEPTGEDRFTPMPERDPAP